MKWVEITIETTEEASDAICEMLAQIGADGIAVTDPYEIRRIIDDPDSLAYADEGFIDSLGEDVIIRSYFAEFPEGIRMGPKSEEYNDINGIGMIYGNLSDKILTRDEALALIINKLSDIGEFLPVGKGYSSYRYVKDEDWANNWKKGYKSFDISDRIIICPSWETPTSNEKIVVRLDPGSAFGTGTHETTSMCAKAIDKIITPDDTCLDVGTGSGILAIICSKLGAKYVEAIDIDELSTIVAKDNFKENLCDDINCFAGELKDASLPKYSLIIANIIADVICDIAKDIPSKLAPGGHFVCSGIINTKKERVEEALSIAGLKIVQKNELNDWISYICEC